MWMLGMMWSGAPVLLAAMISVCGPARAAAYYELNPFPDVPYEQTTLQQDEWVKTARGLVGDSKEEARIEACEKLRQDPTVPEPLQRWATLREMDLSSGISQKATILELGCGWLAAHPDDPHALQLRMHLVDVLVHQVNLLTGFPTVEEIISGLKQIFSNLDAHDWTVIEAHVQFVRGLTSATSHNPKTMATLEPVVRRHIDAVEKLVLDRSSASRNPPDEEEVQAALRQADDLIKQFWNPNAIPLPPSKETVEQAMQYLQEWADQHGKEIRWCNVPEK
jgi:hypothetical protein